MSASDELKTVFTQYWHFMALRGACQLGLFDALAQMPTPVSADFLAEKLALDGTKLRLLLEALEAYGAVSKTINSCFQLTEKGHLLTEGHPGSLKNACLLWGEEHFDAWRNLPASLRKGQPAFDLTFGEGFFQYLSGRPEVLENYQLAMAEYARDDYAALPDIIDFSQHQQVADVGGGTGVLVRMLAKKWPATVFILFEKPTVLEKMQLKSLANLQVIGGDFFQPLPFSADAIILARVLHDWPDEQASLILQNCHRSLAPQGRLYLLEILHDKVSTPALNLHMALICGSRERTGDEYGHLLSGAGFSLLETRRLNHLQSILIAQKKIA